MINKPAGDTLATKANAAFEEVALDVIARAREAKTEVIVWRNGKVTRLSPDQAERELTERPLGHPTPLRDLADEK